MTLLQAEERKERERQEKLKKEGSDLAEVVQMVTSDFLTECLEAAVKEGMGSAEAPRVLPDRWKGMSSEQFSAIYRQRVEQCTDREVCRLLCPKAFNWITFLFHRCLISVCALCRGGNSRSSRATCSGVSSNWSRPGSK